jgi:NAD dependent epimerase/dehydratase family enzyme
MVKLLLTGATGFIGQTLIALKKLGLSLSHLLVLLFKYYTFKN